MSKRRICLNEQQFHNLISRTVKKIITEGAWGYLPLQSDYNLDIIDDKADETIKEQLDYIDENWNDKGSVFNSLNIILYYLQIFNGRYYSCGLDSKMNFTNRVNSAIKHITDEDFYKEWKNPKEVKEYIKNFNKNFAIVIDKNASDSKNFKQRKLDTKMNESIKQRTLRLSRLRT